MLLRRRALWACLFLSISCFLARIVVLGSRLGPFAVSHDVNLDSPDAMDNARGLITCNTTWLNENFYYAHINGEIGGQGSLVRTKGSFWDFHDIDEVKRKTPAAFKTPRVSIDRIYYINLDERHIKRAIMENWLSKQPIPYQRVSAMRGDTNVCVELKQGPICVGVSGVARTNLYIIDKLNTTGITLVLEDDIAITDMEKLLASVNLVPPDWDVLRWDCWGNRLPTFQRFNFSFKINRRNFTRCKELGLVPDKCWFCGGNHIAMWRGEAVEKLRKIWSSRPHDDIDCRLEGTRPGDPPLKTYCINVGVGAHHWPLSEGSDIRKLNDPAQEGSSVAGFAYKLQMGTTSCDYSDVKQKILILSRE